MGRKLNEQWVKEIDGKKHNIKGGCFDLPTDADSAIQYVQQLQKR